MDYRKKAYNIIYDYYTSLHRIGQEPFSKMSKSNFMKGLFPHLDIQQQFDVLVCEVLDSIENHKNRLTHYGRKVFHISEIQNLYKKYHEALYNFDKFPLSWFEGAVSREDYTEIAQVICYYEIQKMKANLACLKQDLQVIEQEKQIPKRKMRYTIDVLGAQISFEGLTHAQISNYTQDTFLNLDIYHLVGKYKTQLAHYLFDNQTFNNHASHHISQPASLLAHNLATSLAHYNANKGLTKSVEFEANLQGGAGKLQISIYPWKFKFAKYDKWQPVLILVGAFINTVQFFGRESGFDFPFILFILGIACTFGVGMFVNVKRKRKQTDLDKKTDIEVAYLVENIDSRLQIDSLFNNILYKLHQNLKNEITVIKSFWGVEKKYANPLDAIYIYSKKKREIYHIGLDQLRDFNVNISKHLCLSVMTYILELQLLKSYRCFVAVVQCLLRNKVEATLYNRFLGIYITTNGFYGNVWQSSKEEDFQYKVNAQHQRIYQKLACPLLVGKDLENIAAWVKVQQDDIAENNLAYDIHQLEQKIVLHQASKTEKVPFILDMEEVIIYF